MGWSTANYIFDPICRELQNAFMVPEARQKVLVIVIKALQDGDWDTEDESLTRFEDDPVVVKAFAECDVFLWGTPEYDHAYGENSVEEKAKQTTWDDDVVQS